MRAEPVPSVVFGMTVDPAGRVVRREAGGVRQELIEGDIADVERVARQLR